MSQLSLIDPPADTSGAPPLERLVSVVVPPLEGEFLYSFDPAAHPSLCAGSLVTVQFGRRSVPAFVVSVASEREAAALREMQQRSVRVKNISADSSIQAFSTGHLEFFRWIAKYYAEPLSKILDLAVPAPAVSKPEPFLRLSGKELDSRLGSSQRAILDRLSSAGGWLSLSDLRTTTKAPAATVRALLEKGFVDQELRSVAPQLLEGNASLASLKDSLTEEQQKAVDAVSPHIEHPSFASFLLHGVTGSGKTEVYLELMVDALNRGLSALVVVPEIALTPQLLDRFEKRLSQKVALLHSSLSAKDRWRFWDGLRSGALRVAVGARSAIFAPMQNLGLIIIDEEHDASFKQGEGIRYHGRDLAIVRAKLSNCPIVLGSATPSLETFHNATTGKHVRLELSRRFFSSPPLKHELIDLNRLKPWEMPSKGISPQLLQGLIDTLKAGEQAFVLYNRRGFASYLQCSKCEHVVGCPHCSVTLTYHRKNNSLLCHFCGHSSPPPVVCAGCGAAEPIPADGAEAEPLFSQRGAGTERVAEELATLLPDARIGKLDRDSVSSIDDYIEILRRVREREVDILVGTQMIAKGHDLPDVTFVGIVDCDVGLHMPDFRAAERSFQLLTQVAGRAGRRDKRGTVVLQTRVPSHASLKSTVAADYQSFAEGELQLRRALDYPPFMRLLRIIIAAEDKAVAQQWAQHVAEVTVSACDGRGISLLGPAPAPLEKVRSHWRYHILCKAPSASLLQNVMQRVKSSLPDQKKARLIFDLDPQDML
jgi:primosomal protein N' (replication factor Y)